MQYHVLERHAVAEGWDVVARFEDNMTGSTVERPGLQRAMQAASAGEFDIFAITRLDRLARNILGAHTILDSLRTAGVQVTVVEEPVDFDSDVGEFQAAISVAFAAMEHRRIKGPSQQGLRSQGSQRPLPRRGSLRQSSTSS